VEECFICDRTLSNCTMLKMEINDMLCSLHVLHDYKVLAQFCNLETNFIKQTDRHKALVTLTRGYSYLIQSTVSTIQTSANGVHQNLTWTGPVLNMCFHSERWMTNCLSQGTAMFCMLTQLKPT